MINFRKRIGTLESAGLGIRIEQCGIIEFKNVDYHLVRPSGVDYQLLFIKEGAGYFKFGDETCEVSRGGAVLYAPGARQEYGYSEKVGALVYFCHFSGVGIEDFLRDYPIATERAFRGDAELALAFEALLDKRDTSGSCSAILALLNLLERAADCSKLRAATADGGIDAVIADIHENYMLSRSIEEYAAICHFSKYHFLRRFKERTQKTPIEYRNDYRLSIAERLLKDSNLTVEAVAEAVGFSSAAYFCRTYKNSRGASPRVQKLKKGN